MCSQQLQLPLPSSSSSSSSSSSPSPILSHRYYHCSSTINSLPFNCNSNPAKFILSVSLNHVNCRRYSHRRRSIQLVRVGSDNDSEGGNPVTATAFEEDDEVEPTADDLECVSQIKRVLELLKKNRDMLFGEVKLTVMIEDPREVERKRLIGIDDSDGPTRDDLVEALEEVNNGKVPRNRVALRMLAEEMTSWPNLEVEATKTTAKTRSLYAKATDTGIDPEVAAKKLNVDWDSAAEIEADEHTDDNEVPSALGS